MAVPTKTFTEEDVSRQLVYRTKKWNVLFPQKPIFPLHIMLASARGSAQTFSNLSDQELMDLRSVINYIEKRFKSLYKDKFLGYNLFSNNGDDSIGQHIRSFHEHMFIRISNEIESPYSLMSKGSRWNTIESKEWNTQHNKLKDIFRPK